MDLTDIHRTFHSNTKYYTFSSAAHGTYFKIAYGPKHKSTLNRKKEFEIALCILSDYHGL